jgi:glycogen synthase
MGILFTASEAHPLIKTSGLADVADKRELQADRHARGLLLDTQRRCLY